MQTIISQAIAHLATTPLIRIGGAVVLVALIALVVVAVWAQRKFDSFITGSRNLKDHDDQHQ